MSAVSELHHNIDLLPEEYIAEVSDFVEFLKTKAGKKTEKKKFPKNPDNPSPSGDPYWDNPANMQVLDEASKNLEKIRDGKRKTIPAGDPEILAIFEWAKQ